MGKQVIARLLPLLQIVFFAGTLFAQFKLDTLTGTIHDSSGGAVANCKITAISQTDGSRRTVTTNGDGILRFPFGTGRRYLFQSGVLGKQSGWQVSGIATAESGLPFGITASDPSTTGGIHTQAANRTCNGNLSSDQRNISHWFNTSCFSQPASGTLDNSARNVLRAPGGMNFDLSASKEFPFGEQRWVQFRTDFFSAFNHPLFSTGNQATNNSTYGQITSASGARLIQFSLKVAI
jgi:hypothetical protein